MFNFVNTNIYTMSTNTAFTSRLQKLLDYYSLSASGFATKIGVQRSSISHILSGRNKPSLDFVMKVLHTFEEVTIEWLVDGKGEFPKSLVTPVTPSPPIEQHEDDVNLFSESTEEKHLKEESPIVTNSIEESNSIRHHSGKKIIKVVLLYNDGSFDAFDH